jgi:hypothetical protein
MHIIFSLAPLISQQFHNENLCLKASAVVRYKYAFSCLFSKSAYSDILWYYILFALGGHHYHSWTWMIDFLLGFAMDIRYFIWMCLDLWLITGQIKTTSRYPNKKGLNRPKNILCYCPFNIPFHKSARCTINRWQTD